MNDCIISLLADECCFYHDNCCSLWRTSLSHLFIEFETEGWWAGTAPFLVSSLWFLGEASWSVPDAEVLPSSSREQTTRVTWPWMMAGTLAGCHFLSITLLSIAASQMAAAPSELSRSITPPKLYEAEGVQRAEAGLASAARQNPQICERSGLRLQHGERATFDPTQFSVHSSQLQLQRSWLQPVLPTNARVGALVPSQQVHPVLWTMSGSFLVAGCKRCGCSRPSGLRVRHSKSRATPPVWVCIVKTQPRFHFHL